METCPIVLERAMLNLEVSGDYKPRITLFLWSFRRPVVSVQFANVLGRVSSSCVSSPTSDQLYNRE